MFFNSDSGGHHVARTFPLFSQYKAKFDQLFALYGDKTNSDTMDPDPMDLAGFEQKYFVDKTKNVLDQLKIGYAGYEVE